MVLLNPGTESAVIDLGSTYQLVETAGGGSAGSNGTVDGSLSSQSVSAFTLNLFKGAILLNGSDQPTQVTGLQAFHRSGQTFIAWAENGSDFYNTYRYTAPINSENFISAHLMASVNPNSGYYRREVEDCYGYDWGVDCSPIAQSRFILEDFGGPLPENTGLFVHTASESGTFYYAVTAVSNGIENTDDVSQENALTTGVIETVQPPELVCVCENQNGTRRVYTHWMDCADWNPAFEEYAYNFSVGAPLTYDGQSPSPLYFYFHAWGEFYRTDI